MTLTPEKLDELEALDKAASKDWFVLPREVAGRIVDAELRSNPIIWYGKRVGSTTVGRLYVNEFITGAADVALMCPMRKALPDLIAAARLANQRAEQIERLRALVGKWMSTASELRRLARGVPSEAARTYMDCAERLERTADELLAILEGPQ